MLKTSIISAALFSSLLLPLATQASTMQVEVEIPRLNVAEYHRPYVAIWIADERQQRVTDLTVWYDIAMRNQEGEQWLKDLRQWWRRSGRTLDLPVDGLSGATRAPGTHSLTFTDADYDFSSLPEGDYQLVIEASREVGGRELLQIPFSWPLQQSFSQSVQGENELGNITLSINL
ncbi:DUF2271 domain-containing protein [Aliidiomarina minuta]|uniref:DUF2271 domain-containing protein n=1 Tax=Aliidiomarina minuta TaxID=880057 RepID=A0A432W3P8_9GAMM|nr:DUF2271 domain-containing protein [Aliidiomarina minuta]RUO23967.1 DUF2271 domain-containing protein [Aliidiomarina minuta]